ncbi:hypothetical protein NC653_021259 [Populus alba x Populus x berolinensis]|uniref:Uncharacterized protein n=1 Tax=Populus alba x Populus x berolinensis TaxID=444605 RepID=A0AAD6MMT4_9ROSI|nr:hypothetical protein NC653_021259 [Populus alba x Populus x berolinensis]
MLKEFSHPGEEKQGRGTGTGYNKKLKRSRIKEKMQALQAEVQKSGASSSEDLDEHTKEKSIAKMKNDIEWEFSKVQGFECRDCEGKGTYRS